MNSVKELILGLAATTAAAAGIVVGLIYGVDGEVARREREVYGHEVSACLFDSNCHNYQPQKGEEKCMAQSSTLNGKKLALIKRTTTSSD